MTTEERIRELREWLDTHERTPPTKCLLCEEPVAKDTVIDHLVDNHQPFQVALLVALWWFLHNDEVELPRLIRDGTIASPGGTQIDLRTEDYEVWVTVKADRDADAEKVVAGILDASGTDPEDGVDPK